MSWGGNVLVFHSLSPRLFFWRSQHLPLWSFLPRCGGLVWWWWHFPVLPVRDFQSQWDLTHYSHSLDGMGCCLVSAAPHGQREGRACPGRPLFAHLQRASAKVGLSAMKRDRRINGETRAGQGWKSRPKATAETGIFILIFSITNLGSNCYCNDNNVHQAFSHQAFSKALKRCFFPQLLQKPCFHHSFNLWCLFLAPPPQIVQWYWISV